jgi:hypothetical protein
MESARCESQTRETPSPDVKNVILQGPSRSRWQMQVAPPRQLFTATRPTSRLTCLQTSLNVFASVRALALVERPTEPRINRETGPDNHATRGPLLSPVS